MELDSVTYANGEIVWLIRGSIQDGPIFYPFQLMCDEDPRFGLNKVIRSTPPLLFEDEEVECVITNIKNVFEITWRTSEQRIYLKSVLTSGH